MTNTILITGASEGVSFTDVRRQLVALPLGASILSGGKKGAEAIAAHIAGAEMIPAKVLKPDWNKHGSKAAFEQVAALLKQDFDSVLVFGEPTASAQQLIRGAHAAGKDIRYVDGAKTKLVRGAKK